MEVMQACRTSADHRFRYIYDGLRAFYCQIDVTDTLAWIIDDAATNSIVAANVGLLRISGRTPRAAGRLLS